MFIEVEFLTFSVKLVDYICFYNRNNRRNNKYE